MISIRHIEDASIDRPTDRPVRTPVSDETRHDETADSSTSINDRIDDRNYDLSFTAGDARRFARSRDSKWDVKLRSGVNWHRIVTLCRGAQMRLSRHVYALSPPGNRTIVPAHSATGILFRRPVGCDAVCERVGRRSNKSAFSRSSAQDRRHRKFCRVMQELLSNAADRRVERREKGGREGAEENGR